MTRDSNKDGNLGNNDSKPEQPDRDKGNKDLDVELDQAHPRGTGERGPGVLDSNVACATNDGGLEPVLEGAVKRHDSLVVLGQEGCLDANEHDMCRNRKEDLEGHGDNDDEEHLPHVMVVGLPDGVVVRPSLEFRDAQRSSKEKGDEIAHLGGEEVEYQGQSNSAEDLTKGKEALGERLGARGRDDCVNPAGPERSHGDGSNRGSDWGGDADSTKEAIAEARGDHGGQIELVATEEGLPAADCIDCAQSGAEGGGGCGALAKGLIGIRRDGVAGGIGRFVEGNRLVGRRRGIFDYGEDREDVVQGVTELEGDVCQQRAWEWKVLIATGLTTRITGRKTRKSTNRTPQPHEGMSYPPATVSPRR